VRTDLLVAMRPGSTWVDLSTSTSAAARANVERASHCGVRVLDAPMGGGPTEARTGALVLFVGGLAADLDAQRDVTDALAAQVLPCR
jgi:3-hydroxyisobutyrate dehydrogenase-like beta-hydroxyacid dehydrogenase